MQDTIKQSKAWVYSTAFLMSFNGGFINLICLISVLRYPVGYVTGNLTDAGASVAHGHYFAFFYLLFLIVCFLFGSILSGLIVKSQALKMDKRYDLCLILQFIIVLSSMILLSRLDKTAAYLLAFTMGLQNAMTTHYGSALIRTTHMTGTTTDLGLLISQWLKGESIQFWKVRLYCCLIFGFMIGAVMGTILYGYLQAFSLSLSLLLYCIMWVFQRFINH